MMIATFNGNPSTKIISRYSSTTACDEKDLTSFYYEVPSLVHCIHKCSVQIIGRDMNAEIGKGKNN